MYKAGGRDGSPLQYVERTVARVTNQSQACGLSIEASLQSLPMVLSSTGDLEIVATYMQPSLTVSTRLLVHV